MGFSLVPGKLLIPTQWQGSPKALGTTQQCLAKAAPPIVCIIQACFQVMTSEVLNYTFIRKFSLFNTKASWKAILDYLTYCKLQTLNILAKTNQSQKAHTWSQKHSSYISICAPMNSMMLKNPTSWVALDH